MDIRTAVLASLDAGQFFHRAKKTGPVQRSKQLGTLLRYAITTPTRGKKRMAVDVDALVQRWVDALAQMSLAHDKDSYDAADAQADELLAPLLAAPVAQVRDFYGKLQAALEADPRIPMLVWLGFQAWGEVMVKNAPDAGIKKLKNQLAQEIAELVEQPAREQLPQAIQRALRWRDAGTLQEIKSALQEGEKPRLVGRESCLFLVVGKREVML